MTQFFNVKPGEWRGKRVWWHSWTSPCAGCAVWDKWLGEWWAGLLPGNSKVSYGQVGSWEGKLGDPSARGWPLYDFGEAWQQETLLFFPLPPSNSKPGFTLLLYPLQPQLCWTATCRVQFFLWSPLTSFRKAISLTTWFVVSWILKACVTCSCEFIINSFCSWQQGWVKPSSLNSRADSLSSEWIHSR